MIALIIIFVVFFALLAWRRLDLATALVIAALPAYQIRFNLGFLPMTLLEAMILVLFAAWFIKAWRADELPLLFYLSFPRRRESHQNIKQYPFHLEIILLLIVALVSAGAAGFTNASLGILKAYFIEPVMFFIVFVNVFKIKENRNKIFWALAISAFVVSLVAIYQWLSGNLLPAAWQGSGRVTGAFAYPNALGLYLGPIIITLSGWLLGLTAQNIKYQISNDKQILNSKLPILKALFVCSVILLSVTAIYFSHSQGALIGLIIALVIFGVLYNWRSRLIVTAVMVAALITLSLSPTGLGRLQSKIMLRDLDGQIRRQQWAETKKMLLDGRIITGAGLANYQMAVAPHHQEGIFVRDYNDSDFQRKVVFNADYRRRVWQPLETYLYPHNIFLNFWSELGLVGMLLFLWIIVKYFLISLKSIKSVKSIKSERERALILGLACAMIVIVVHGLVDAPYFKNDLAVLFWVLAGMMGVYQIDIHPQINKSFTNNTNKR